MNEKDFKQRLKRLNKNSYNIGPSLDVFDFEDFNTKKEQMATDFSEDSVSLKNLLLFLWNLNIKTCACCAGHLDKPFNVANRPYISIYINDNSNVNILNAVFVDLIKKFDNNVKVSLMHESEIKTNPSLCFFLKWDNCNNKIKMRENFFNVIVNIFKQAIPQKKNLCDEFIERFKKLDDKTITYYNYNPQRFNLTCNNFDIWFSSADIKKYCPEYKNYIELLTNGNLKHVVIKEKS